MQAMGIQRIGLVGAGCGNTAELAERLTAQNGLGDVRYLTGGQTVRCRCVSQESWDHVVNSRYGRRLDRFSKLALVAAQQCLDHSPSVDQLANGSKNRTGIVIGNNFGGWGYVEPQMEGLYAEGMDSINPYVATAWFPAAAQGEISIRFGLRGHSKTFSADRLSAGVALEYSRLLLGDGTLDWVLVGGAEAPDSLPVLDAMYDEGLVSQTIPAGEAACLLLLSRNCGDGMGVISGIGRACDVGVAMKRALDDAQFQSNDIDCVFLDRPRGVGPKRFERFEIQLRAVARLFGPGCKVALPLPFGETVGAAMAVEVAVACLALRKGEFPASECEPETMEEIAREGLILVPRGGSFRMRNILLNASDAFEQAMSIVVSRTEERR
jgi:3-oxoacyl-(acyl-carrier-protein) synthase